MGDPGVSHYRMANLMAHLIERCFGPAALGEIYGYTFGATALGGVVGPISMGYVFDYTGSYNAALEIFVLATVLATGLIGLCGCTRRRERAKEGRIIRKELDVHTSKSGAITATFAVLSVL